MKKREIRIPPLPPRQKSFLRNQKAFFVFGARAAPKTTSRINSYRRWLMRTKQFKNVQIVRDEIDYLCQEFATQDTFLFVPASYLLRITNRYYTAPTQKLISLSPEK
ncbi:MAG: hypothetical protein LBF27_19870, partial [Sphingobacterium sp.]|nr:hypothetical protein [Sphingobacterium sp.]